jgi:hypothetical protein
MPSTREKRNSRAKDTDLAREDLDLRTITEPVYQWMDHSRYVEVIPVQTGWLVNWGLYKELGKIKLIYGTRTYRDESGVRRRIAATVLDFTKRPSEANDALTLLDRQGGLPMHRPAPLKNPL